MLIKSVVPTGRNGSLGDVPVSALTDPEGLQAIGGIGSSLATIGLLVYAAAGLSTYGSSPMPPQARPRPLARRSSYSALPGVRRKLGATRSAVIAKTLGAGAHQGALVAAGAMAVGVAILTALAVRNAVDGLKLRWLVRLGAVGLIACGVVLTVDGT
jgi:hypothetical protein